jgi:hypothetical protein
MYESKEVTCPECGEEFQALLRVGECEYKDGWHGECPAPFCWFWYFEPVSKNTTKVEEQTCQT